MKTHLKTIIVGLLVLVCLLMTYYFHFVVKTQVIFTHLFYVPIVIASIYWRRAGIYIAILLGVDITLSQYISPLTLTHSDFIRPIMFVVIACVVTIIMNRHKKALTQLRQSEEYIVLNKELRETNEQLQRAKKELEQHESELKELNATKDKILSIIAHDLKSPFNSIIGFSELLSENLNDYDKTKTKEFIGLINFSAKHTLILLDNLLVWAKTQTGQIDFKPEKIEVKPIIQNIIDILSSSALFKNISLNHYLSNNIEVYADPNMLNTILRNLIANAIKFTNNGGKVDISAVLSPQYIEVTVADNGIGIDEVTQSNLFKKDVNYTSKGTANEKGSGLGLMLCKEFVEKHGGKIWVVSELGKGSNFKFTIPLFDTGELKTNDKA